MSSINSALNPVSKNVEFFEIDNKPFAMTEGSVIAFSEWPLEIAEILNRDLENNPVAGKALDRLGITDSIARLYRYACCRYGTFNITPDFSELGKCTDVEVSCSCAKKETCPAAGLLCCMTPITRFGTVTEKEMEVAMLIAKGLQTKEIATQLNMHVQGVASRINSIFEKTGYNNRTEIARWVNTLGL